MADITLEDKGKPVEMRGRKTMNLRIFSVYDSPVAKFFATGLCFLQVNLHRHLKIRFACTEKVNKF